MLGRRQYLVFPKPLMQLTPGKERPRRERELLESGNSGVGQDYSVASGPVTPACGSRTGDGEHTIPMENRQPEPWVILKSREMFVAAPWIRVFLHQVRLPDGRVVDDYHHITLPEHVIVFAQTTSGRVIVERQYKHGVGQHTLVLPSGLIKEGEEPLSAAKRELMEETGFISRDWRSLGAFVVSGNYGCGKAHLFMARSARQAARADSGDLEDMEILLLRVEEVIEAVRQGRIVLLGTMAAIALSLNPILASTGSRTRRGLESSP